MTIAEGEPPPSRETRRHRGVPFALFCVFLIVRIVALDADPPSWLSWSAGIFTDEGIYAADARSVALTGHWAPGDFHSAIVAPLLHLVQLGVFRTFGVGLVQARLVSVAFSLGTLALFHGALRRRHDARTALLGTAFWGLSIPFVFYNRLALLETPTVFWLVAAYAVWAWGGNAALTGVLLAVGCIAKPIAILAVPAYGAVLWRDHRALGLLAAGLAVPFLAYGFVWYLPHHATLVRMNAYYLQHQYAPHSFQGILHDLKRGLWTGEDDGVLPYLVRREPVLTGLALVGLAGLRRDDEDGRIMLAWLAVPILVFLFLSYTPSRYFVLFWPPLAALAARALAGRRPALTVAAVGAFALFSATQLTAAWNLRAFTLRDEGRALSRAFPPRTLMAGQFAPALCLSNAFTAVYVQPNLANDRTPLPSAPLTAILVTRSAFWDDYWRRRLPGGPWRRPAETLSLGPHYRLDVYVEH